jgi:hypothetical protein
MRQLIAVWMACLILFAPAAIAAPQSTAFTYQGSLELNGNAFSGQANFEFRLWSDSIAGSQVAAAVTRNGVLVDNGVFTVDLDFGAVFGTEQRWLQIIVNGQPLTPRQPVAPTPMAIYALSGLPGPQGPVGPVGPPGVQGPQGVQGPPGLGYVAYGGSAHEGRWIALGASASYASVLGTSEVRPNEERMRTVVPSACTMRDLRLSFITANPAYAATTATLMRNGAATALTCSVSLGGTGSGSCTDLVSTVALSAGDTLSLQLQPALPNAPLTNTESEHQVYVNFGLRCLPSS